MIFFLSIEKNLLCKFMCIKVFFTLLFFLRSKLGMLTLIIIYFSCFFPTPERLRSFFYNGLHGRHPRRGGSLPVDLTVEIRKPWHSFHPTAECSRLLPATDSTWTNQSPAGRRRRDQMFKDARSLYMEVNLITPFWNRWKWHKSFVCTCQKDTLAQLK